MRQRGFTLIELSIVLVIIGMMVGAIVGGRALVHQAELQKVVKDLQGYKTAFNAYTSQYNAVPGDDPLATQYWPGKTGDGNGDGMIWDGWAANGAARWEDVKFFDHLFLAEIIPFKPRDYTLGAGAGMIGVNLPKGSVNGHGYRAESAPCNITSASDGSGYVYGKQGLYVVAGTICTGADLYCSFLTPADAKNLDSKLDDGLPASGGLMADEWGGTMGLCVSGKTGTSGANPGDTGNNRYNVGNTTIACNMVYWLK